MACNCNKNSALSGRRRDTNVRRPIRISPPVTPVTGPQGFTLAPVTQPTATDGKTLTSERRRIDALRREAIRRKLGIG